MASIQVEGLAALIRDFRRLAAETPKQTRQELKALASIVAAEGKSQAAGQGLDDSGALIGGIKPGVVRGWTAVVKDTTMRRTGRNAPYAYPAMYEYAKGRPFLGPAVDAKTGAVMTGFEGMVNRLAASAGF